MLQGFSFFAMLLVGIGVVAYNLYKNADAYSYGSPNPPYAHFNQNQISYRPDEDDQRSSRKRKQQEFVTTCSICMEVLHSQNLDQPRSCPKSAISLPCDHIFHRKCVTPWLQEKQNCPNCRAPAIGVE